MGGDSFKCRRLKPVAPSLPWVTRDEIRYPRRAAVDHSTEPCHSVGLNETHLSLLTLPIQRPQTTPDRLDDQMDVSRQGPEALQAYYQYQQYQHGRKQTETETDRQMDRKAEGQMYRQTTDEQMRKWVGVLGFRRQLLQKGCFQDQLNSIFSVNSSFGAGNAFMVNLKMVIYYTTYTISTFERVSKFA